MATVSRLNQIVDDMKELDLQQTSQLVNFIRYRLMDLGVIGDERKEKNEMTERFGNRPWLDTEACRLKAALADAVEDFRMQPSRMAEDRVHGTQRRLMRHLHHIYESWTEKMHLCRENEERNTARILTSSEQPPLKKARTAVVAKDAPVGGRQIPPFVNRDRPSSGVPSTRPQHYGPSSHPSMEVFPGPSRPTHESNGHYSHPDVYAPHFHQDGAAHDFRFGSQYDNDGPYMGDTDCYFQRPYPVVDHPMEAPGYFGYVPAYGRPVDSERPAPVWFDQVERRPRRLASLRKRRKPKAVASTQNTPATSTSNDEPSAKKDESSMVKDGNSVVVIKQTRVLTDAAIASRRIRRVRRKQKMSAAKAAAKAAAAGGVKDNTAVATNDAAAKDTVAAGETAAVVKDTVVRSETAAATDSMTTCPAETDTAAAGNEAEKS